MSQPITPPTELGLGLVSFWFSHATEIAARATSLDGVSVRAGWDSNAERGREYCASLSIPFIADLDALLAREDIHAVALCGPADQQAALALRAIAAGKHVIVEKPMATSAAEAQQVAVAARERGVQVMPAFNLRFNPAAEYVKSVVDSGVLGRITRVRRLHGHFDYEDVDYDADRIWAGWREGASELALGSIFHSGSHAALWFDWMFGMPSAVHARAWKTTPGLDVEDNATVLLTYPDFVASMETSETLVVQQAVTEIQGTEGAIFQLRGDLPAVRSRGQSSTAILQFDKNRGWFTPDLPAGFIRHEAKYSSAGRFLMALLQNEDVPTSVESGARSIAILEAARESAATGREVALDALD
ncbi:MAG: Gfo/Idh/MocA family protein [Salinibacterium amurskyense]